jgi:hypothetical protein
VYVNLVNLVGLTSGEDNNSVRNCEAKCKKIELFILTHKPNRIWEQATIAMLGKEEAAAVAPHEKDFLHECLRVKREREGLPTLPHSGYSSPVNGVSTSNNPGRSWFGPVTRIVRTGRKSLDKCGEGMRNGEWEVSDLMADINDLTHRAKKTDRRLSKLEQNALSHAKVASEFQRVWTGMTSLADRTMQEIQKVQAMQAQVEGAKGNVAELSSGELSPFSTTSASSERPAAGCSLSSIKDANIETDQVMVFFWLLLIIQALP